MQRAGAAESAANLVAADRFADMMHHHERGARSVAQAQQRLAQGRHGARIVFVLIVRRAPVFDRHVEEIYDQRKGRSLPEALGLAAFIVAPGEELFWRGLFQGRLASAIGWPGAAALTWGIYIVVNAASESLPILLGAVVSGAVWGGLALWTHGVLASLTCHTVWTGLMLVFPPGGSSRRPPASEETPGS